MSLSGRFTPELGKFGFSMAVANQLGNLYNDVTAQATAKVKTALLEGTFTPLETLAEDPLHTFYNSDPLFPSGNKASALFEYLLSSYPGDHIYRFARCGDFDCLGVKDWKTLESDFISWVYK